MRKLILIAILMFSVKLFANPVMLPPVISEFYYNGGDWQIEVYFAEDYQGLFYDFSEIILLSNADTAYFIDGLTMEWNTIMVIDQSCITSDFYIDPEEDWIRFAFLDGFAFADGIRYGNNGVIWWNTLTTPKDGESIVKQYFFDGGDGFYEDMKDNTPSIGSNVYECSSRGTFSGYVFDQYSNSIEGVKLAYCPESYCIGQTIPAYACIETDENGYFETDGLFSNWHIFKLQKDGYVFMTDTIFIEPDSVYYKEYTLTNVGIYKIEEEQEISIYAAPNPFVNKTTFHISIPNSFIWQEAQITIRDNNGRIIDKIPITGSGGPGNEIIIDWYSGNAQGLTPSGMYLYSLEVDGKLISSHKMIIQ